MTEHHNVTRKGEKVNQPIVTLFKQEQKPTLQNQWTLPTAFSVNEFKAAFLEYVIGHNLTLRQSVSSRLRRIVISFNLLTAKTSHHLIIQLVHGFSKPSIKRNPWSIFSSYKANGRECSGKHSWCSVESCSIS